MKKFTLFALAAAVAIPMTSMNVAVAEEGSAEVDAKVAHRQARKGKKVAVRQCVACHDITQEATPKVGPPLWGMYGKKAGSAEGYTYSETHLQKTEADGIVWDEATLDTYLMNPQAMIPGNKMVYPGLESEKQRKNLIEYMKTLK